jgi:Icc-related predicted phosphoesterase
MKLCCISDTHGQHQQLDLSKYLADVLVFAGDWTAGRDVGLSETANFVKWFSKQPYEHKILVAGNHEREVEKNPEGLEELLQDHKSITYLNNTGVTIDGINFWGSPYSNEFCSWAFMDDEDSLEYIWEKIPDDTNVLVTHGPAYRCNDEVKRAYARDPHVGSQSLTNRKKELEGVLKLHISGHIHEAYNTEGKDVCASILNERYQLVNKPIIKEVSID